MKSHDRIATRLAIILSKLNSGERFSIDELIEEFNVTKRTIQRDLNQRLSYLPLKRENNFFYLEEYYLGKLNFDDIKNFATLSGIKELYPSLNESFLKSILDDTINKAYLIKGHNYEDLTNKEDDFKIIEDSIINFKQINFSYKDKNRVIHPYKILNKDGIWYLVGVENEILKTFSIKKIKQLTRTDKEFILDKEIVKIIENEDNIWFSQKQIEVVLKVDKSVSQYFKRRNIIPNQVIVKSLEDGSLLVSCKVSFDEEILKIVRYWIPNVEIISPDYLNDKLHNTLIEYIKTKGIKWVD